MYFIRVSEKLPLKSGEYFISFSLRSLPIVALFNEKNKMFTNGNGSRIAQPVFWSEISKHEGWWDGCNH